MKMLTRNLSLLLILLSGMTLLPNGQTAAQIYYPEGLNMPGAYNGWTNPPTNVKFANPNQVPGGQLDVHPLLLGQRIWQTKFHANTSGGHIVGGTYGFLFTSGPIGNPWLNKWGGVSSWTLNIPNNVFYMAGTDNFCTFSNGKYYTVNWWDQGYVSTKACIMETSAPPVAILTVSNSTACAGTPVTVSFTLSGTPSAEEKFYVRWTTTGWATSSVALASISGTTGTVTIPAYPGGTTVNYYVFSSTVTTGDMGTDFDLCTINLNSNGGVNYTYVVSAITISGSVTDASCSAPTSGAIDITVSGGTTFPPTTLSYAQDFNSLISSGSGTWTDNSTLPQWYSTRTTITASNGSTTTGGLYSFGTTSASDRALGSLASGSTGTIRYGVAITNTTATTLTSVTVNYTGEQWRCGGNTATHFLDFAYQIDAASLTAGTWIDVNPLDFASLINNPTASALDGNLPANRTTLSHTFSLSLPPGSVLWLRWTDVDDSGSDHGLAVDDISVSISAPGIGYIYSWSNGATTEDLSGLSMGTYTVTVTDAVGCTATQSFYVDQPGGFSLSFSTSDATCPGGSDGSIDLTITGGTAPFSFNWSNGATTEDISGLTAGTYTVTVTDAASCSVSGSATINQPPAFSVSTTVADVSCNGGSDGAIDLTVYGATPPYTYLWSTGATSEDISGLTAGTYTVTITDINGCTATTSAAVGEPAPISLSTTVTDVSCHGGADGAIDLAVSGGSPSPLPAASENFDSLATSGTNIPWVDNGTLAGWFSTRTTYNAGDGSSNAGALYSFGSASSTERALGSVASGSTGTIHYGIALANTFGEAVKAVHVSYRGEQWRCGGNTAAHALEFSWQLNAADLTSGTWTDENALDFVSLVNNPAASALDGNAAGNHTNLSHTFNVSLPHGDALWLRWTDINDVGNDHGLAVDDLTVVFITESEGYYYVWSDGATTQDVASLSAGTYTVTVYDLNGCNATTSATVNEPAPLALSESHTDITCDLVSDGTIDLIVSGGTAPYSYLWNDGATTEDRSGLAAGTYTVTVTDDNGCSDMLSVTLINLATATTWYADTDADTYGDASSSVMACVAPAGYVADNTDCDDSNPLVNPGAAEVCSNGIDDNCNGLVDENDVTISASASGSGPYCHGTDVLLTSSVSGPGPHIYQWYRGINAQLGATDPNYTTTKKGTFYVTVNNGLCSAISNTVDVDRIPSPPASVINLSGTTDLCLAGGSINLRGNGGLTSGYTYQWYKDGNIMPGITQRKITVTTTGSYTVEVTNSYGCTAESAPEVITTSCRLSDLAQGSLLLYPNPANGRQVVVRATLSGDAPVTITISTLLGQEVLRLQTQPAGGLLQQTLDLPATLASGTYVVKLTDGHSVHMQQLVVQR